MSDTVKCKMQILVSGSISLSGHLPVEMFLRVVIQQAKFHLGIYHPGSKSHRPYNGTCCI